jgi:hypothetical protein
MENQRNCIAQAVKMKASIRWKTIRNINEMAKSGGGKSGLRILTHFVEKPLGNQRNQHSQAAGLSPPKNRFPLGLV